MLDKMFDVFNYWLLYAPVSLLLFLSVVLLFIVLGIRISVKVFLKEPEISLNVKKFIERFSKSDVKYYGHYVDSVRIQEVFYIQEGNAWKFLVVEFNYNYNYSCSIKSDYRLLFKTINTESNETKPLLKHNVGRYGHDWDGISLKRRIDVKYVEKYLESMRVKKNVKRKTDIDEKIREFFDENV